MFGMNDGFLSCVVSFLFFLQKKSSGLETKDGRCTKCSRCGKRILWTAHSKWYRFAGCERLPDQERVSGGSLEASKELSCGRQ
jgi:hypothetical protein